MCIDCRSAHAQYVVGAGSEAGGGSGSDGAHARLLSWPILLGTRTVPCRPHARPTAPRRAPEPAPAAPVVCSWQVRLLPVRMLLCMEDFTLCGLDGPDPEDSLPTGPGVHNYSGNRSTWLLFLAFFIWCSVTLCPRRFWIL